MERMRRLRAGISPIDGASRFAGLGVDVFLGHGEFVAPDRLRVNGDELNFRRAIIATGARAALIPVPGLEDVDVYTNETIFSLTELPPRLVVIGAGPIGVELAQTFARFGSRVTVVHADAHPLPRDDSDAAAIVTRAIEADGVRVLNSAAVLGARREDGVTVLEVEHGGEQEELAAEAVLVAAGRAPNVAGMGLEAAGVAHDRTGIRVDDQLRTTAKGIYAVGDVASKHQFTHAADHQARIAVQNALFFGRGRASRLVIPWGDLQPIRRSPTSGSIGTRPSRRATTSRPSPSTSTTSTAPSSKARRKASSAFTSRREATASWARRWSAPTRGT